MSEVVKIGVDLGDAVGEIRDLIAAFREIQQLAAGVGPAGASSAMGGSAAPMTGASTPAVTPPSPSVPAASISGAGNAPTAAQHVAAAVQAAAPPVPGIAAGTGGMGYLGSVAGSATMSASGTVYVTPPVAPPPPSPYASAMAGGGGSPFGYFNQQSGSWSSLMYDPTNQHWFDPSNGSYMLGGAGFGFGAGGPKSPSQPKPEPGMWQALAAAGAVQLGQQIVSQAAGQLGQAQAAGSPFYSERLMPAGLTLGLITGGAVLGGPVGAMAGAAVGGAVSAWLNPIIERNISEDQTRRLINAVKPGGMSGDDLPTGLPTDMLTAISTGLASGHVLSLGTYGTINGMYDQTPSVRGLITGELQRSAYTAQNLRRFGDPEGRDLSAVDMMQMLVGASYGNEFGSSAAINALGFGPMADSVRSRGFQRIELEDEDRALKPREEFAAYTLQRSARYHGSAGVRNSSQAYFSAVGAEVGNMRARAKLMREGNDLFGAAAQEMAANHLETQRNDEWYDTLFANRQDEVVSGSALATGRATRRFGAAQYTGAMSSALPWDARASAALNAAASLQQLMADRGDRLSPADRARMTEQIESYRYEANVVIPKEREETTNRQTMATHGLASATYGRERMEDTIRGSVLESAMGQSDAQIRALQEQKRALEEILSTSKMLTYEQRTQLQTSLEQVRTEQTRAQMAREVARVQAEGAIVSTQATEMRSQAFLDSVGVGGVGAAGAAIKARNATQIQLDRAQQSMRELLAEGFDPNSDAVREQRGNIAAARQQLTSEALSMGIAPISAGLREKGSYLETKLSLSKMGLGSFGDVRMSLRDLAKNYADELKEADAYHRKALSQPGLTDNMKRELDADYATQRNQIVQQMASAQLQYSEGFDQRLLSDAYNMPAGINGNLALTNFTRREAILHGVSLPGLGGTEQDTERWRMMYPNAMRLMSGDRGSLADRTISGADLKNSVTVKVQIEYVGDAARSLRTSGVQATQFNSAQNFNQNDAAKRSPSG